MTWGFTFTVESHEPAHDLLRALTDYYQKMDIPARAISTTDSEVTLQRGSIWAISKDIRKISTRISISANDRGENLSKAVIHYELSALAPNEAVRRKHEDSFRHEVETFKLKYPGLAPANEDPAGKSDLTDELERLGGLYDRGVLTDEEFRAAKKKLLR